MMAGIKGKNTKPEITIRKLLHAKGYRFRLHKKELPGKPDIVLPKYHVAIFVHGCFWHGHSECGLFRLPKSRTEFWKKKTETNVTRDRLKQDNLVEINWRILTIWECAIRGANRLDKEELEENILNFINYGENKRSEIRGTYSV